MELSSDIKVTYVQHTGDDEMIAKAARVSTGLDLIENDKKVGLINYLARELHTSPFEHNYLTVRVEAPIFVSREAIRHRTFSYNEISGRYAKLESRYYIPGEERPIVNEGSGAHPVLVQGTADQYDIMYDAHHIVYKTATEQYERQINAGIATEVARDVLPVGTYTAWYMSGNLHAWSKFLYLRDGRVGHPQEEIQMMANQVWPMIEKHWPIAAKALKGE